MSEELLLELTRFWVRRLRLQDWRTKIRFKGARDLAYGEHTKQGYCEFIIERKEASIWILHPDAYPNDCTFPQDVESTLIHELLHLLAAPLAPEDDTPEQQGFEQMLTLTSIVMADLGQRARVHGDYGFDDEAPTGIVQEKCDAGTD